MADIGIEPGPFSFLAEFGRAGGAAFKSAEEERVRQLEEDQKKTQFFLGLRAAGLMTPKQFEDPAIQSLFIRAYGPGAAPSSTPTPAESLSSLKGEYMSALGAPSTNINIPLASLSGPGSTLGLTQDMPVNNIPATARFTPEQRAMIEAPQQSALTQERVAQKTGAVQLAEATPTEQAKAQFEQDKQLNDIADAVVQTLYNRNGKMPSAKDAATYGIHDPRASIFGSRINETHYGAAIERMRRQLEAEKTSRIKANQTGTGGSPVNFKMLGQLNKMVEDADKKLADYAKDPLLQVYLNSPDGGASNKKVQEYRNIQAQRDMLFEASSKYASGIFTDADVRNVLNKVSTTGVLAPAPTTTPKRMSDALIQRNAEIALKQHDPEAALDAEVKAGRMDPADKAAIIAKMREISK